MSILGGLVLLLASCGGDGGSDTSAASTTSSESQASTAPVSESASSGAEDQLAQGEDTPCQALSQDVVDGALGGSFPGSPVDLGLGTSCQYSDGTNSFTVTYSSKWGKNLNDDFVALQDQGSTVSEVALGDFAYRSRVGLSVQVGDGFFTIAGGTDSDNLSEDLAKAILAELGA